MSSITADDLGPTRSQNQTDSDFVLKGSRLFSGNGRAIFIGIVIGTVLLLVGGTVFNRQQRINGGEPLSFTKFVRARTHTVSASPHELIPPAPVVVQMNADLLHVSAIALGHPRLAVINGQSVAEGDYVKVRAANSAVTVALRVVKIGDGRIDLTDGIQTITTKLSIPLPEHNQQN